MLLTGGSDHNELQCESIAVFLELIVVTNGCDLLETLAEEGDCNLYIL